MGGRIIIRAIPLYFTRRRTIVKHTRALARSPRAPARLPKLDRLASINKRNVSHDYNYEHIRGMIHCRGREDIFSSHSVHPLRRDVSRAVANKGNAERVSAVNAELTVEISTPKFAATRRFKLPAVYLLSKFADSSTLM